MGRTVIAEKALEPSIKALVSEAKYGLIIGQNTTSRAQVAHLSRSPPDTGGSQCAGHINDSWIAKHAKQVIQLLPGGLDILGIFIIGGSDLLKTRAAELRGSLSAIYRALDKLQLHDPAAEDRLVAAVDPRTHKVTCRSVDLSSVTSSFRPAEWRSQEVRWHRAHTELDVEAVAGVTPLAVDTTMFRQIMTSLESFLASLSDAVCLVDGKMAAPDALLAGAEEKPAKAVGRTFTVDLLCDMEPATGTEKQQEQSFEAVIRVHGRVHCVAFLHTKATVAETLAALCRDARRSLLARCQMHCDSLVEEQPADGPATVLHEPPRRVLAPLPGAVVHVSDYLFPGDSPADSLQTLAEMFGLQLTDRDVLDTIEMPSEDRAHSECSSTAGALDDLRDLQTSGAGVRWLQVAAALAICALGIGVSSLMLIGPRSPGHTEKQQYL